MKGISISACYELTAPKNRSIAREVYFDVAGKGLSLAEVREKLSIKSQIEQQKLIASDQSNSAAIESAVEISDEEVSETEILESVETKSPAFNRPEQIDTLINVTLGGLKNKEKLEFLKECIAIIKKGGL